MLLISAFILAVMIFGWYLAACTHSPKDRSRQTEEGTKKTSQPVSVKPGDFFPLTRGSTWKYRGEGNEYASFYRQVLFAEGNRGQIREDNGGTVSAAVFEVTDDAVTRVFFMGEAYGEDNFLNHEPAENIVILKTPIKVGTKWEEPNGTREIVDVNAEVSTPAGRFEKCVKVKISTGDSTLYEYFKDKVGMVKREFVSAETRVTSILEEYEIK